MAFVNNYKPPTPVDRSLLVEPYDINWAFPLPSKLETPRVKLVPFIPSTHIKLLVNATKGHPDLFKHMPFSLKTEDDFNDFVEWIRSDSTSVLFAIIDKTKSDTNNSDLGGSFAGMIGLYHTSSSNLITEIGPAVVVAEFQRTHVSSNAIGTLLRWCFDLPSAGGLGMRRVQWAANPLNIPSVKVAEKMGFKYEGTLRWLWVLPEGKEGTKSRDGDPSKGPGRDSILLAMCWDDWLSGVQERVDRLIER